MGNFEGNIIEPNKDNVHKSRCTECPSYNECMGVWLDYFSGKGHDK
ncbi:hypothetical protein [Methanobacterium oryzae]